MIENRLMDLCNSIYGGTPDEIALNLELLVAATLDEFDLAEIVGRLPVHLQRAKNNAGK